MIKAWLTDIAAGRMTEQEITDLIEQYHQDCKRARQKTRWQKFLEKLRAYTANEEPRF